MPRDRRDEPLRICPDRIPVDPSGRNPARFSATLRRSAERECRVVPHYLFVQGTCPAAPEVAYAARHTFQVFAHRLRLASYLLPIISFIDIIRPSAPAAARTAAPATS